MFNKSSVFVAVIILAIGMVGYVMAGNERAYDACHQTQSADTCSYIFR